MLRSATRLIVSFSEKVCWEIPFGRIIADLFAGDSTSRSFLTKISMNIIITCLSSKIARCLAGSSTAEFPSWRDCCGISPYPHMLFVAKPRSSGTKAVCAA